MPRRDSARLKAVDAVDLKANPDAEKSRLKDDLDALERLLSSWPGQASLETAELGRLLKRVAVFVRNEERLHRWLVDAWRAIWGPLLLTGPLAEASERFRVELLVASDDDLRAMAPDGVNPATARQLALSLLFAPSSPESLDKDSVWRLLPRERSLSLLGLFGRWSLTGPLGEAANALRQALEGADLAVDPLYVRGLAWLFIAADHTLQAPAIDAALASESETREGLRRVVIGIRNLLDGGKAPPAKTVQRKRSRKRGEARTLIVAALTTWHQYDGASCLKTEPVGNNELARKATVVEATASKFFKDKFGGRDAYIRACRDPSKLVASLQLLNGDFQPRNVLTGLADVAAADGDE